MVWRTSGASRSRCFGTYVTVEPFHLFRYLDERSFHFNDRKLSDAERFDATVKGIVDKRLMYYQLTERVAAELSLEQPPP